MGVESEFLQLKELRSCQLARSNSTSSIWSAGVNLNEPKQTELLSSVATMLHCQMMRDMSALSSKKNRMIYFCESSYTGKQEMKLPTLKVIYMFIKHVFDVGQFHSEASVICLVYINRLIGITGVPLTENNWKPIMITALVLAQKVWDDTPLINADFNILYPALGIAEINFLERKFLDLLDFKLTVSASLYAQYYFELRSISEENHITFHAPVSESRLKEPRKHISTKYQANKAYYKKRTMTVERIRRSNARQVIL